MRPTARKWGNAPLAGTLRFMTAIEARELKAVTLSALCFLFLFASYSVVKPVRDAMGTVYGMAHIQELFTGTFVASLVLAPVYSGLASRIKLSTFLPLVYGFVAVTLLIFAGLFTFLGHRYDHWTAAAFYIWVSTFNMLIVSVFWTFMADLFSRDQAKRLFGFIAAGATLGGIIGPALATTLVGALGNRGLVLVSAVGFMITAVLITSIAREKDKLLIADADVQRTTLDHGLKGRPFDGFRLLVRSRYLLLVAVFLLLMTWISAIVYIQLGDLITHAFTTREARTQAYAAIDLAVNSVALLIQLIGTGRLIERFGVTTGLLVNPVIMVAAFLAVAFSPVLLVLGSIQVIRRVGEYAVAKPTREMLFTLPDQESRYKAKNVIDTIVYRFGDLSSAWISSFVLPFGVAGLAVFGAVVSVLWFPVALALGRLYESPQEGEVTVPDSVPLR
jgi:ATP:ADP antiporter, AAA family